MLRMLVSGWLILQMPAAVNITLNIFQFCRNVTAVSELTWIIGSVIIWHRTDLLMTSHCHYCYVLRCVYIYIIYISAPLKLQPCGAALICSLLSRAAR